MTDKLGDTLYFDFSTHNPTTGAVQDADSTPTAEVFEDATDTPIETPTVTKRTGKTGSYRIPVTATGGGGYEVGKSYLVYAIATVGGIADRYPIGRFTLDGKRVSDLNDIAAGAAMTLTGAYDAAKTAAQAGDAMDLVANAVDGTSLADGAITSAKAPNLDAAVTTRGTADPGDAMTLTSAYDAAKTAAQATDLAAVSTIVTETRRIVKNKLTLNKATSELELWDDIGTSIILTWPATDKDGNPIVLTGTGPANRGVPS